MGGLEWIGAVRGILMKKILSILAVVLLMLTTPAAASQTDTEAVLHYFSRTTGGHDQLLQTVQLRFHTLPADTPSVRHLQQILSALEQQLGRDTPACAILVRPGPQVNAYALPSHIILVNEGALTLPEDELQVLLAHELGHIRLQHPDLGIKRSALARHHLHHIRSDEVTGETASASARRFLQAACTADILRTEERAADVWAAARLRAAGLDPQAGVRLMRRLEHLYGSAANQGTHLPFDERQRIYRGA